MKNYSESTIINCLEAYRKESEQAKKSRMDQNKINFDCYHLQQDFSYKQEGQSREFLPKMSMAVEQAANFIQQGLTDIGDWFRVETEPGVIEDMLRIKPNEIFLLTNRQLQKCGFLNKVGDSVKLGLIGSLMIAKVGGKRVNRPIFRTKLEIKNGSYKKKLIRSEDKAWQLDISLLRQENYFPDPTGRGLYEMEDLYMDYWEIERLAKGPDAIYDLKEVEKLQGISSEGDYNQYQKSRETGQDPTNHGFRKRIKLTEIWGNILDEEGNLAYENVVCTIANDQFVIQKPTPNPFWHGESPYVSCAVISVPNSVWGKALMDAPAMLNRAQNEMFNLILDGGLMSVHGIKQIRKAWLDDDSQVENGIYPGVTLAVNAQCPPGATVLERVDTSTVPQDGLAVLQLLNSEGNAAALTSDFRSGGAAFRKDSATEVVESSQTLNSMFTGIAKSIEGDDGSGFITRILQKAWKVIAQNIDDLDSNEVKALVGEKRASEMLAMGNEEIFADTVQGCKFKTFGISATLNKQKDFTKLTALLQTIGTSDVLTEAFIKEHDFSKILKEIMKALDINPAKISADKETGGPLTQPISQVNESPNIQSQIPQAGAAINQESVLPSPDFPPSRATPANG